GIVETGTTREIFNRPRHPYTIGLLNCLPTLRQGRAPLTAIEGQPPDLAHTPSGCAFAPRCSLAEARCEESPPPLANVESQHLLACRPPDPPSGPSDLGRRAVTSSVAPRPAASVADTVGNDVLLEARQLTKHFALTRGAIFGRTLGTVKAVDGVDFVLRHGETL